MSYGSRHPTCTLTGFRICYHLRFCIVCFFSVLPVSLMQKAWIRLVSQNIPNSIQFSWNGTLIGTSPSSGQFCQNIHEHNVETHGHGIMIVPRDNAKVFSDFDIRIASNHSNLLYHFIMHLLLSCPLPSVNYYQNIVVLYPFKQFGAIATFIHMVVLYLHITLVRDNLLTSIVLSGTILFHET